MAKFESNQMRRAHRVDIPLTVVIKGHAYRSKDWSMTGVGVDNLAYVPEVDEIMDGALIISLQDAKLEIPVKLLFKVKRGNVSGFEFSKISEKNRRVLREFLELSLEGKLEQVDGIMSIYNEPIIDSPIKESVVFSDAEETAFKKAFAKRAKLYIGLGVILLIVLLLTIFYNTSYVYRSIGTVSGNFMKVSSGASGQISKFHISVGDKVYQNDILFTLNDQMILNKIDILERKLVDLKAAGAPVRRSNRVPYSYNRAILDQLQRDKTKDENAYASAKELFYNRLISKYDLQKLEAIATDSKIKYLKEKDRYRNLMANSASKVSSTPNTNASMISLITQLELQREELIGRLNSLRVLSPVEGEVYAIKYHAGHFITSSSEVLVIEINEPPFVVCKLKQEEALNITKNMVVKVYSDTTNKTYTAHVQTMGNLSLNTNSEITGEVGLKEVTVQIVFDDKELRLQLNDRVKVWFYRPLL